MPGGEYYLRNFGCRYFKVDSVCSVGYRRGYIAESALGHTRGSVLEGGHVEAQPIRKVAGAADERDYGKHPERARYARTEARPYRYEHQADYERVHRKFGDKLPEVARIEFAKHFIHEFKLGKIEKNERHERYHSENDQHLYDKGNAAAYSVGHARRARAFFKLAVGELFIRLFVAALYRVENLHYIFFALAVSFVIRTLAVFGYAPFKQRLAARREQGEHEYERHRRAKFKSRRAPRRHTGSIGKGIDKHAEHYCEQVFRSPRLCFGEAFNQPDDEADYKRQSNDGYYDYQNDITHMIFLRPCSCKGNYRVIY